MYSQALISIVRGLAVDNMIPEKTLKVLGASPLATSPMASSANVKMEAGGVSTLANVAMFEGMSKEHLSKVVTSISPAHHLNSQLKKIADTTQLKTIADTTSRSSQPASPQKTPMTLSSMNSGKSQASVDAVFASVTRASSDTNTVSPASPSTPEQVQSKFLHLWWREVFCAPVKVKRPEPGTWGRRALASFNQERQELEEAERARSALWIRDEEDEVRFGHLRGMSIPKSPTKAVTVRATERALDHVRPGSAPPELARKTEYAHGWLERTDERVAGTTRWGINKSWMLRGVASRVKQIANIDAIESRAGGLKSPKKRLRMTGRGKRQVVEAEKEAAEVSGARQNHHDHKKHSWSSWHAVENIAPNIDRSDWQAFSSLVDSILD